MNGQNHGGKGSAQRPVDQDKFNDNWDAIFAPKSPEVVVVEEPSDVKVRAVPYWGIYDGRA